MLLHHRASRAHCTLGLILPLALLLAAGCGDSSTAGPVSSSNARDAGIDGGLDGGSVGEDGGVSSDGGAGEDTGLVGQDTGRAPDASGGDTTGGDTAMAPDTAGGDTTGGDTAVAPDTAGGDTTTAPDTAGGDAGGGEQDAGAGPDATGGDTTTAPDTAGGDATAGEDAGTATSTLCNPCGASTECVTAADADAACVDHGASGAFCGTSCKDDGDCAQDYECKESQSVEGIAVKQCVRAQSAGECTCSDDAIAAGASTACYATDPSGKVEGHCPGTRTCTSKGLGDCTAAVPAAETCDGTDQDCDGATDEGTCDDDNPCTADTCQGKEGCKHQGINSLCNDGDACTGGDACKNGTCSGDKIDCNDGNACTDDACDMATGCTQTDNSAKCSDGNLCSADDQCLGGACAAGKPKDCDDHNPCTADSCEPKTGNCSYDSGADGAQCDDGDLCTSDDACAMGKCAGKAVSCDDNDPCTDDACDALAGCTTENNTAACDDHNACTEKDACKEGTCAGAERKCDDGNPCTDDACDAQTGCTTKANTAACDDGSKCTKADSCAGGSCSGADIVCDDNNPCTDDGCDMAKGCTTSDNEDPCTDDNACTSGDKCSGGSCRGTKLECDDGNVCTDDACDMASGCTATQNTDPCDDGNACTLQDRCTGGLCKAGRDYDCNDGRACTADSCDPQTGMCVNKVIAGCKGCTKDAQCDDGNPCVLNACVAKACKNTTKKDGDACADGNFCTVKDTCFGGLCKAGPANNCDDGNACTADKCDTKAAKCRHTALGAKAKCGATKVRTEEICLKQGIYRREAFKGCNGSKDKPLCSGDAKDLSWTDRVLVKQCKAPKVCHIDEGVGSCGPPRIPDLTVASVTTDAKEYPAGARVKVTFIVKNGGNGSAGPSHVRLFRAYNAAGSSGYANKATVAIPKIAAGKSYTGTANVVLWSNWTTAKLYIGAIADVYAKVYETDENNNRNATMIKVKPAIDLLAHYSSYPRSDSHKSTRYHGWGTTGTYTWRIYNVGRVKAGASEARLYFSMDKKFDAKDVELAKWKVGPINPGKSLTGKVKYKLPTKGAAPGWRYLFLVADVGDKIKEGNEHNNVTVDQIYYIGYNDVVAIGVVGPPTADERRKVKLSLSVKNAGNQPTAIFYDRVYASRDKVLSFKHDVYLGQIGHKSIPAGKTVTVSPTWTLPKALTAGTWYLIYRVDWYDRVKGELSNSNNTAIGKITIVRRPDLYVRAITGNAVRYHGDINYFRSYTRNYGLGKAGAFKVRHYLSTDTKVSKDDLVIGTRSFSSLAYGRDAVFYNYWKVLTSLKPGTWYLLAVADYENKVQEIYETNNVRAFKWVVRGRPDLTPVALSASSTRITAGDSIDVTATTKNVGTDTTGKTFNDRIYWSYYKTGNTHYWHALKDVGQKALGIGLTSTTKTTVKLPAGLGTHTYYLVYFADASRSIPEANEANNARFLPIAVKGIPNLRSFRFYFAGTSLKAGNKLSIQGGVVNYGLGAAGAFRVGYYLSKSSTYDASDKLLGAVERVGLGIKKSISVSRTVYLPSDLGSGTYYVLQIVDDKGQVAESNESDNLQVRKISVSASADLVAKSITVKTPTAKVGAIVEGSVEQVNAGSLSTGKGYVGHVRISRDGWIDSKDQLVQILTFAALPAGKTATEKFKFLLPAAVTKGTWYVGYHVDGTNVIAEGSETNNFKTVKITVE